MQRPLLVFDVNETLLDLDTLSGFFARRFGDTAMLRLWFANLVLYSQALSLARSYVPFGDIGAAVLQMLAKTQAIVTTPADELELKGLIAGMPALPDVHASLSRLKAAGFRLFTLTNNPIAVQDRQLEAAGILPFFERRFSVEDVQRHKPARETYERVQQELDAAPSQLLMVACHTWDTLGAVAAGWRAALIKRPGNAELTVGPQPTWVIDDLHELSNLLLSAYGTLGA